MNVIINGDQAQLADGATVEHVVEQLGLPGGRRGVAVAVDAEVVPRSQWAGHQLHEGARVEILHAVQGG